MRPLASPSSSHPGADSSGHRGTANGLLYIAEVIEEHAQLAKTVGQRLVYVSPSQLLPVASPVTHTTRTHTQVEILLLAALYAVDGLPLHLVAVGILAHVV